MTIFMIVVLTVVVTNELLVSQGKIVTLIVQFGVVGKMMSKTYTQNQAAERLKVSRQTVVKWINNGNLKRTLIDGKLKITDADIKKVKRPINGGNSNVITGKLIASIEKILILLKSKEWSDLENEEITGLEQMLAEIKKK